MPGPSLSVRVNRRAGAALGRLSGRTQVRLSGRAPITVDGLTLEPELQLMLASMAVLGEPSYDERLSPRRYRSWFAANAAAGAGLPLPVGRVADLAVPGPGGALRARHYAPPGNATGAPLLVFLHGGGFVVGNVDTHDATCRMLCRSAGVHVLSVDYRLAPEHPFPAAHDDAVAAFAWGAEHAEELGADPGRVLVGGDSAGGLLSIGVTHAAKAGRCPRPALQLLLYPSTDSVERSRSRELFGDGFYLTEPLMDWFFSHFMPDVAAAADPRWTPLRIEDLSGLAPAVVATAGFDPLRDEGEAYAERLREAGVPVVRRRFDSLLHGFANMLGPSPACRDATAEVGGMVRSTLALVA